MFTLQDHHVDYFSHGIRAPLAALFSYLFINIVCSIEFRLTGVQSSLTWAQAVKPWSSLNQSS